MPQINLTAEIIGAEEMREAFAKGGDVVRRELGDAIQKTAFSVEGKAKSYAPIQYGVLRGSINTQGPTFTANNVQAVVGTNVKYAKAQEEGTGIHAGKGFIYPKNAKMLRFKVGGQWVWAKKVSGVKGKFFFKKARQEAQPLLEGNLKGAIESIMKFLAKG